MHWARNLVNQQNKHMKNYIVVGRIPFDEEDTVMHVQAADAASLGEAFTLRLWADNPHDALPEDWRSDPYGNRGEPWVTISTVVEITEPPVAFFYPV